MPSSDALSQRKNGGIADLSRRAKLRLTGADRIRYLNGQVTANVTRLTPQSQALPACVTTPKGKLSADVFVTATADALLIDAEPELRESLLARLDRYIISDDAAIEDVTDAFGLVHLLPDPGGAFAPPATVTETHRANRFGVPGLDLFVPAEDVPALIAALSTGPSVPVLLPPAEIETLRIEGGIPRWGCELGEDTLPPEAGLDHTHIDYNKGCYIGQEIISRLKSVGHVNRQLLGFSAAGEPGMALHAGMHLYTAADEAKAVGQLTSAAYSEILSKSIALGYLRRGVSSENLFARDPSADPSSAIPVASQKLPFVP